ncbi:MAG: hypothetical protein M1503_03285 [Thaumarchaeota archaeon]|nr:hypothetical protein [Nitrososphaerota archaeon]
MSKSWRVTSIALLTVTPILFIILTSMATLTLSFFDPCLTWGFSGGSLSHQPIGPCSGGVRGTSDTFAGALLRLISQGGLLITVFLGVVGVHRVHPRLLVGASIILFAVSVPLIFDGLFLLTLIPAIFFLWSARRLSTKTSSQREAEKQEIKGE